MIKKSKEFCEFLTRLTKLVKRDFSEKELEDTFIKPLLIYLGYTEGINFASQAQVSTGRIDFLISGHQDFPKKRHYLVIEAKVPRQNLNIHTHQIKRYLRSSGSIFGLLTNGRRFRLFYNYDDQINEILDFSHKEISIYAHAFGSLLWKPSCDNLVDFLERQSRETHNHIQKSISRYSSVLKLSFGSQNTSQLNGESLQPMIITVFNNKGGVGKTSLTINLGAQLAKLGKRVLLIDIDAQSNLTTGLGVDPISEIEKLGKKDIGHLLTEPMTKLEDIVLSKKWDNVILDIIPSHIRLSNMENQLIQLVDSDRSLEKKLRNHTYDFVFIDPPPSFGKVNRISLMASQGVLIPTQLHPYSIRALEYVLSQVEEVSLNRDHGLNVLGIAVSMHNKNATSFNFDMKENLLKLLSNIPGGQNIALYPENTWIPQLQVLSKTQEKGYPLMHAETDLDLSSNDRRSAENALIAYESLATTFLKNAEVTSQ